MCNTEENIILSNFITIDINKQFTVILIVNINLLLLTELIKEQCLTASVFIYHFTRFF